MVSSSRTEALELTFGSSVERGVVRWIEAATARIDYHGRPLTFMRRLPEVVKGEVCCCSHAFQVNINAGLIELYWWVISGCWMSCIEVLAFDDTGIGEDKVQLAFRSESRLESLGQRCVVADICPVEGDVLIRFLGFAASGGV